MNESPKNIEGQTRREAHQPIPITRIFRVKIVADLREEFEEKFSSISVHTVNTAPGFLSVSILKPTIWAPDEYAMISLWKDEAALESFAGKEWRHPVIPKPMEKYVVACWVHHYRAWA